MTAVENVEYLLDLDRLNDDPQEPSLSDYERAVGEAIIEIAGKLEPVRAVSTQT